jgi:hypothetical protein
MAYMVWISLREGDHARVEFRKALGFRLTKIRVMSKLRNDGVSSAGACSETEDPGEATRRPRDDSSC